jgi:hypothetical protein
MKTECICEHCGKTFTNPVRRARFCTTLCNRKARFKKNYIPSEYEKAGIGRSNVGAANELKVAADLMLHGYDVFRALSPQCPCDLAILKAGALLRVEVRTGQKSQGKNKPFWPKKKHLKNSDIWAVVLPDEIIYDPPIIASKLGSSVRVSRET